MMKPEIKVTLAHSRDKLLSSEGLKDDCKEKAKELLEESGVQVLLNHRLVSKKKLETGDGVTRYEVEFTNGHKMIVNDVTMAISKSEPSTSYMPKSALDEEGYIKINPK
jgi:thioredoxin reductase